MTPRFRLGIDFGTSNTTAVLAWPDGRARPLLFEGSPVLPSGVCADPGAGLSTGRDARHTARSRPDCFEPAPKRLVGASTPVLLGDVEVPVADLVAAVFARVRDEAGRVAGTPVTAAVLTCPAGWGPPRRDLLATAASRAGLVVEEVVPEPVAAAGYFIGTQGAWLAEGACAVVYDFGAGTFDASVVRRTRDGFALLAVEGLAETGGADIDAAVVAGLGESLAARDAATWRRLTVPASSADRRAAWQLWEDVRTAKEMLSRAPRTSVYVPLFEQDLPLGREELERLATPLVARTVAAARAAVDAAGVPAGAVAAVFLVGGASRLPLAATLLHREFGVAPTVVEQPELVVAEGALGPLPRMPTPAPASAPHPVPAQDPAPHPPPVDEVAPERTAPRVPRRRRALAALALAGLVVAVAVLAVPRLLPALGIGGGPDTSTVLRQHVLATGGRVVRDVEFSPDGKLLAVNDGDQTVQIWDVGKRLQLGSSLVAGVGTVTAVAFVDGARLAVAGDRGEVRIWNVSDRTQFARPLTVGANPGALASTVDGQRLAVAVGDEVQVWDVAAGLRTSRLAAAGGKSVLAVDFNHDGTALAAAGFDGLWLWDSSAGRDPTFTDHSGPAHAVAFSPDGRTVVTGSDTGGALLWDTRTGRRQATLAEAQPGEVPVVDFSPDGERVLTAGFGPVFTAYPVRIWDPTAPGAAQRTLALTFEPRSARFSPDGRYIAVGGNGVVLFEQEPG
ncbi:Hsp70 family protein [Phytohabitans houttuyneae]|uniref:Uncharacterized protein n=1 Tax=Phytohabitans houttuyneae TaxID=1076126 RepID=A0A6V8KF79_9ACTN|nr:Hsp70 family protein [Phytohabitans houttuyneae]GFJ82474.1 hypothetical protein Phou_066540 [Phytohabitans houttuyneae]